MRTNAEVENSISATRSCHWPHGAQMVPPPPPAPPPSWDRGHGWGNGRCFLSSCVPMACCNRGRMFYLGKGCKVSCLFCNTWWCQLSHCSPTCPCQMPTLLPILCPHHLSPVQLLSLPGRPQPFWVSCCVTQQRTKVGRCCWPYAFGVYGPPWGFTDILVSSRVGTVGPEAGASPQGSWRKPVCRL